MNWLIGSLAIPVSRIPSSDSLPQFEVRPRWPTSNGRGLGDVAGAFPHIMMTSLLDGPAVHGYKDGVSPWRSCALAAVEIRDWYLPRASRSFPL